MTKKIKELVDNMHKYGLSFLTNEELLHIITGKVNLTDDINECLKEYARRLNYNGVRIRQPKDIIQYISNYALNKVEQFGVVLLNANFEIIDIKILFKGTLTGCFIHVNEIMREVLINYAATFLVFHNHPSGNIQPSDYDNNSTRELLKASKLMGVQMLDHVIITPTEYYSYEENGVLK